MDTFEVQLSESGNKGKAYMGQIEKPIAAMTFSKAGEELLIIDHTEVDDAYRGKGLGRKLLDKIVTLSREKSLKVMPLCPYAKSVFDKDASIQDLLRKRS